MTAYTSLIGGARVAKYDPRPEAYGTLDEASAALGLARATATMPEVRAAILEMQRALYRLMAELATVEGKTSAYEMTEADVARVEELTNDFTARVPVQREFVVPGDTVAGAALDVARTVVRRGERLATRLVHEGHNANPPSSVSSTVSPRSSSSSAATRTRTRPVIPPRWRRTSRRIVGICVPRRDGEPHPLLPLTCPEGARDGEGPGVRSTATAQNPR